MAVAAASEQRQEIMSTLLPDPRISIAIPAFHEAATLYSLIVVDDGFTDGAAEHSASPEPSSTTV